MAAYRINHSSPSTLETLREMAGDFASKSQALLSRSDQRAHQNPYIMSNASVILSRKPARLVSVILYLLFVSLSAMILAIYYWASWRPDTSKIFKHQ